MTRHPWSLISRPYRPTRLKVLPNLSRPTYQSAPLNNRLNGFRDPQNRPLNSGVLDLRRLTGVWLQVILDGF